MTEIKILLWIACAYDGNWMIYTYSMLLLQLSSLRTRVWQIMPREMVVAAWELYCHGMYTCEKCRFREYVDAEKIHSQSYSLVYYFSVP